MNPLNSKLVLSLLAFVALSLGSAISARADLVIAGSAEQQGTGIGNVVTILSFNVVGPQANITEEASIVRTASGDVITAGANTQINGGANNQTRALSAAGITNGSEFRLVLNINETGPALANEVTLVDLSARFYTANGTLLHVANLTDCGPFSTGGGAGSAPPCVLPEIGGGIGSQGILFSLTAPQATLITGFITQFGASGVFVGIGGQDAPSLVTITNADGGFETFNLARGPGTTPVPEPATMILLGTGLAGIAAKVRKRRDAKKSETV